MKKQDKKKLVLGGETLRLLSDAALSVVGGGVYSSCEPACTFTKPAKFTLPNTFVECA